MTHPSVMIRGAVFGTLMAAACAAGAQEVTGQKPATQGGVVPKNVSVTQQQLSGAGAQGANWLHTNGDYFQLRF